MSDGLPTFARMSNPSKSVDSPDDEIDLRELALELWNRRVFLAAGTLVAVSLAVVYAFLIAKPTFISSSLLLPVQSPASDQFGAAAALLGGKRSSGSADVDLYQSLLTSRTVIGKLLLAPIANRHDTGRGRIQPLHTILGLDTADAKGMEGTIAGLQSAVEVGSKESGAGGILEVRVSARSPWLAKALGDAVLEIGQEELRQVRVARSEVILKRLQATVEVAHDEWREAARAASDYRSRNRSLTSPEQFLDLSVLQMEQSAREQKYLLARKELEAQRLEASKATPPMMILDPATLPARKSKPKRLLLVVLGGILGLAGSCAFVLARHALKSGPLRS